MTTMREPSVSVVMPVYNAERYLVAAVASIIEQTYRDWEMICIDDGSQDGSGHILDWFSQLEPRIRVVHQPNAGIVAALNLGCRMARGPLICRMDADDIAMVDRLQTQSQFLCENPTCSVVGGAILEMDSDGDPLAVSRLPRVHAEIVSNLLHRRTGLYHPTTMFRAQDFAAAGGYRAEYEWVEDHDLWLRMTQLGQAANVDSIVLGYRQHANSVCWQRAAQQRELMNRLLAESHCVRGLELPPAILAGGERNRSSAGPGKWARAAAKGGYAASALKHLHGLLVSRQSVAYKARMALEVALRLPLSLSKQSRMYRSARLPSFEHWEHRAAREIRLPSPAVPQEALSQPSALTQLNSGVDSRAIVSIASQND